MKLQKSVAVSESGFIFNSTRGDSFSVNPIGLEIMNMLKEGKPREEIVDFVLSEYEIDRTSFEKDITDFTNRLSQLHLLD